MPGTCQRQAARWFQEDSWLAFVLPLAIFLLVGALEPTADTPGGQSLGLAIGYAYYPWVYTSKIILTLAVLVLFCPAYRGLKARLTPLAVMVGLVGAAAWIALARLRLEQKLASAVGLGWFDVGTRSAFNPFQEIGCPTAAWAFLAIRFFGLVVVIAAAEELFLRGYVLRLIVDEQWWRVPIGQITRASAIAGTLLPMFMHPQELFAAAVWFSLVTWLMTRTRSIWDCVLAHGLTNLCLGLYAVFSGHWELL